MHRTVLIFGLGLAACATARAELPSIRFDRMQPLGTIVGGSIEVEIAGRDIEDVTALLFDHPGLKAELLKPNRFKITVAADTPEGTYDVYLAGRFGVSNSRLFAVSRDLADVAEVEPNNAATEAQRVALNVAINGGSDNNGQDGFRFAAKKGERIVIDCQAARLDSPLDATLTLSSAEGQILGQNGDYHGRDPFLDFLVPADGEYVVVVHDLSYRGGFPYRLLITTRPQVENVFPQAVEAGKPAELTAYGRNLQPGGTQSIRTVADLPLDEFRFTITAPADLVADGRFVFLEHPTDHSVLPTAATCTLDGMQVRAPIAGGALHPACLLASATPVTVEAEPNDDQHPQPLTLPAVVAARLNEPRDADWYRIEPTETGAYTIEVYSERIAGRADPFVVVYDEKNNPVGELDDYGHRMNAFDAHLRDPVGSVNLQAKQAYRVLVQDRYSRGGGRYQYVLAIRKPAPDFHAAAIHLENPGPAGTNLWRGGTAAVDVIIHQNDGFNAPITITAADLPPGVHAAPTIINGNTRGVFVLWSDPDAPATNTAIRLMASGVQGDLTRRREVRPYTRVWSEANIGSSRPMRDLKIGVHNTAPYVLKIVPDKITVEAGKKTDLKLAAVRYWPEFKENITVIPLGFSGNFNLPTLSIAGGAAEIDLPIQVQANTRPGDYTLTVLGQAQVPYNKDPENKSRPNTLVSSPSLPVTITVVAPPKP